MVQCGGGANSKKVNTHPKIPEIDLDFFRLLLKLSQFSHKTILRCIGGEHMVMYDKFKTIFMQSNKKLQKNFEIWVKKSQYCPKIPEIDFDFLDFFRPKNKLSQFDHKIMQNNCKMN